VNAKERTNGRDDRKSANSMQIEDCKMQRKIGFRIWGCYNGAKRLIFPLYLFALIVKLLVWESLRALLKLENFCIS